MRKLVTLKRIGVGLVGLTIGLGAYKGYRWLNEQANKPMLAPTREAVDEAFQSNKIGIFELEFPRTREGHSHLSLIDENGDGLVDVFSHFGYAEWIAEGHNTDNYVCDKITKTMSPEMRGAASRMLQARKDLYFETWKKVYEIEQARREEERK